MPASATDNDVAKIANELGLNKLDFGDGVEIKSISKHCNELIIYSIAITDESRNYAVKIAISDEIKDITELKIESDKIEDTIFDSEDEAIAPSVHIQNSMKEAKAIVYWNGYIFNVTAEKISTNDLYNETIKLAKIISKENIK